MATMTTDLNELHYFVQVSRAQSFTLAARRLGVPKSSVSRALQRLEERLGVRLVERTTRSVALTEAGELYLDHCERVMEEAELAELAIGAMTAAPRGRLRVGAPVAFARGILAPVLGEFVAMYPDVRLRLHLLDGRTSPREGSLDVQIRPGPLEDSGLLVKPLLRVQLGMYASPAYLKKHGAPTSPAELRQHSCITTGCGMSGEPEDTAKWRLKRGAEMKEIKVESRVSVPDPAMSHQLALSGAGVALLSQAMTQRDVAAKQLKRVLPEWEPLPVELLALYSSRLQSAPKVRAFLDFLRGRFGKDAICATA
jgi:DNA-binding transcriptional LysR family regulator